MLTQNSQLNKADILPTKEIVDTVKRKCCLGCVYYKCFGQDIFYCNTRKCYLNAFANNVYCKFYMANQRYEVYDVILEDEIDRFRCQNCLYFMISDKKCYLYNKCVDGMGRICKKFKQCTE